jgi:F0F1-type ATP synthase assembly protein I
MVQTSKRRFEAWLTHVRKVDMNRITWRQAVAFVAVVLVTLVIGIMLLPLVFGWYGGAWTMGPGMMGGQTQGDWCPFCGGTGRYQGWGFGGVFGWFFMLGTLLFPLGLLVLLILGIVWVARAVSRPTNQSASPGHTCPKCGKAVEVDWRACPFCAEDFERLR